MTALPGDPPRYALLETARLYALGRLKDAGHLDTARRDMASATLHLLDSAYGEYWSLDEAIWLERYGAELANVRAALDWASANDKALAAALYGCAWPLYAETELYAEARARYEQVVRLLSDQLPRARLAGSGKRSQRSTRPASATGRVTPPNSLPRCTEPRATCAAATTR